MFRCSSPSIIATACVIAMLPVLTSPVEAQEARPRPAQPPAQPLPQLVAIDDATLGNARGGEVIVVGNQALTSGITSSLVGNYTAGTVSFSGSAFSNFAGMGNIVVNTGAQASLQSAINLTVNLGG